MPPNRLPPVCIFILWRVMDRPKFVVVDQIWRLDKWCDHTSLGLASLLNEFPSGNQVDGLRLVAHTGEDDICPEPHP